MLRPVQYRRANKLLIGELLDIGDDGMRLRVTQPLGVGTELTVYLSMPASVQQDSRMCVLDALVVWEEGSTAGLVFAEGPSPTRDCIAHLLARQTQALAK